MPQTARSVNRVTPSQPAKKGRTLKDLLERLGNIPAERIRMNPPPGTAKARDLINACDRDGWLCELVDGVLVEKAMGSPESFFTVRLIQLLANFVEKHDLGYLLGPDGMTRFLPKIVRLPDISFVSWERAPSGEGPDEAITKIIPNLTVEVISPGNTALEMQIKLKEYFRAGVELAWLIYRDTRTVDVYTKPRRHTTLGEGDVLTGGKVLPGFRVKLSELFASRSRRADGPTKKRKMP